MVGDIVFWMGMILSLVIFLGPEVFLFKSKWATQAELVKISANYDGINRSYFAYIIVSLLVGIPLVLLLLSIASQFGGARARIIWSVGITLSFSYLGSMKGLFAMRKGVYPTSKFFGSRTTYAYDEDDGMRRLGRLQVYSAIAVSIVMALSGLIGWLWIT